MIEMAAEKFFGENDVLVKEVGGSLAYGQNAADPTIVKRIEDILVGTEVQADDQEMATFYDITSVTYPDIPDTMLQQILSNKNKYIPYLAAQLKDLFTADYTKAAEIEKGYI